MLCICHSVIYDCFICHPDNVPHIYRIFDAFICNGGVFIFFLEVRIWILIRDDILET